MLSIEDVLFNINQSTNDYWNNLNQSTMDKLFENNNMRYIIKEQNAYPFTNEYSDIEVIIDTISDDLINTSKVYSDFIKIIFKDCNHKQNYKGQYYKINLDGEHEEYYICYDRINKLQQTATTKLVRCNNTLTWKDDYGNIIKMPCYLGTDITSTNNQVSKDATIPNARLIILVQSNKDVMKIRKNQRFMFQHGNCFRVEEVNNYMQEQGTDGEITCVKMYIDYNTLLPTDNIELNICDYYKNDYHIQLNQNLIEQVNGFHGVVDSIIYNNNNIISAPLEWTTSDSSVVEVDNKGNYKIVGKIGDTARIKCCMKDNNEVYDFVDVKVVFDTLSNKTLVIHPNDDTIIKQGKYKDFDCCVYIDNERQLDDVECIANGVNEENYYIEKMENGYRVYNKKLSNNPLILTFKAEDCEDVNITIKLKGAV